MTLFNRINNFIQQMYTGTVSAVDTKSYTLTAVLDSGITISDTPWLSPQGSPDGTGAHCMYTPGDRIMVCEYAYGVYIVMGALPVQDRKAMTFINGRKVLNLGDNYIGVSDQAYILLQKPEFITISANHSCRIQLDGTNNIVYTRAQRYQVQADGGNLYWTSDPDTDKTVMSWILRDKAAKDANVVHIRAGFHKVEDPEAQEAQIDKSVFSIIVKKVVQTGEDTYEEHPQFKLIVGEDGRILQSANSIKEKYREYIDRYAGTTMTDVAEEDINTTSNTASIFETANSTIINTAPYINHTD